MVRGENRALSVLLPTNPLGGDKQRNQNVNGLTDSEESIE